MAGLWTQFYVQVWYSTTGRRQEHEERVAFPARGVCNSPVMAEKNITLLNLSCSKEAQQQAVTRQERSSDTFYCDVHGFRTLLFGVPCKESFAWKKVNPTETTSDVKHELGAHVTREHANILWSEGNEWTRQSVMETAAAPVPIASKNGLTMVNKFTKELRDSPGRLRVKTRPSSIAMVNVQLVSWEVMPFQHQIHHQHSAATLRGSAGLEAKLCVCLLLVKCLGIPIDARPEENDGAVESKRRIVFQCD
ncbi:hypothetical protein BDR07DRAFT_1374964 [Suillus spraguei]|nr:hypothetical protein BDR07DRAFT_1374964 [Suillus spraguei]